MLAFWKAKYSETDQFLGYCEGQVNGGTEEVVSAEKGINWRQIMLRS